MPTSLKVVKQQVGNLSVVPRFDHEATPEAMVEKGTQVVTQGPQHHCKDAWPTLVVEAGHSGSLDALRDDMRWLFSASDHQVNIVLLIIPHAPGNHPTSSQSETAPSLAATDTVSEGGVSAFRPGFDVPTSQASPIPASPSIATDYHHYTGRNYRFVRYN
ncbi:hypothetical protein F5Y10DRAFT_235920 [Nemania abortiva]|nr:hypothetical protein F5Y10DRAFT_235920 [Nemania abortiva]